MSASTVYLFVRTPPEGPTSAPALRRLKALQELRDELRRRGDVIVTAAPQHAESQVEITNVFASDDTQPLGDDCRVIVIRLSAGEERTDLVCADARAGLSAEQQAARRIATWLERVDRRIISHHLPLPDALTVTPSNC